MRDTSGWSKELRQTLLNAEELKDYTKTRYPSTDLRDSDRRMKRIARLISEVELGLTLLKEIAPDEPATSVSALLSGYRFPVECLSGEENWARVKKARFYLLRRKGRQWESSLSEYMGLPETLKIFALTDIDAIPLSIPSSIYPRRYQLYRQTLSIAAPHRRGKIRLATAGTWYARISLKANSPVNIPITIPPSLANIAPSPSVSFESTRQPRNPPVSVALEDLLETAGEMDSLLVASGGEAENYRERLRGIALRLYDERDDDFHPSKEIHLARLVHIVGLLNVGKSTLLEILIYHLAKRGYRCSLIVNDVVSAVRIASLFSHRLDIPAVPVLGRERAGQLEKVYESLFATSGEEINQGATHPAWRWFSPICPLLALVRSEEKWEFGAEPCHTLYRQAAPSEPRNNDEDEEGEEIEDLLEKDKFTCPLYYRCPRHQLERDTAGARVWVLTPASLIYTHVPREIFNTKLTWAEAVYRESDFLFVDEADRVQVQLDECFAPAQVLVDSSGNSFLNKLGLNFANSLYSSDRRSMAAEIFAAGKRAHDYAQIATDIILPRLHTHPELVEWLGKNPFTGRSLFSHLIRDLLEPPELENAATTRARSLTRAERRQQLQRGGIEGALNDKRRQERRELIKTVEGFLEDPLNPKKGGDLSHLALTLLKADNERTALGEVSEWLEKWLKSIGVRIQERERFEAVTRNLHACILVTVLNDRLGFLVDHLNDLIRSQIVDLHDLSQALVYRPPRDFLPVVPSAPVGNILGFRYTRESGTRGGGKLEYFRYVGVGRSLLLDFPTLWDVDGRDGPHTVLISGTSYAPGSPAYHITEKPTVLLEPATDNRTAGNAGISDSRFVFSPQRTTDGPVALSGLPPAARRKAAEDLVKAICYRAGQAPSFLDRLFERLQELEREDPERWADRQRVLLITNSYDEAEWVESLLKPRYRVENVDGIATLRRDNAPAHLTGIRRGQIRDLKNLPTQIVIAPLMALERGHNILNDARTAAFGAAVFLSRPMPVPDDWQITVQQLNHWALSYSKHPFVPSLPETGPGSLTLARMAERFYLLAVGKMLDLNCRAMSFAQLTDEERSVLCWTQLVSIWQIVGRLVRGGVPCLVHFLDVKFAPRSVDNEPDNETTSLLAGIIRQLEREADDRGSAPYEKTLLDSLYGAFFTALKSTENLYHDL
jgi:hypothetical protein